ncbi:diaminopimelate epimerase [Galdieria sulphuraria]|uniref:diaminopimelate epimerase n=1 Tax=Galdieria sulphuraria TaxID=130081 RepID=M2Y8W8_GALSU|nr:diaminopimelate epimerase [Galdieria sulphuraria]EME32284.1 diaminopimelate epimerase [Galdieria sulphuraria]|eukprot:XP_005708804.1 diaminopimelate epimerase [Galdieria sulphuraria]
MSIVTTGHVTTPSFLETLKLSKQKSSFAGNVNVRRKNSQHYRIRAYFGRRANTFYLSLPVPELGTLHPKREMELSPFPFFKYQGLGNDFIIVDNRHKSHPTLATEQVKFVCERRFGIGADGVIFLLPPKDDRNDAQMRILNSDGSEPEMCGNGIRCLAKYMRDISSEWRSKHILRIETLSGIMLVEFVGKNGIKVDMGKPILDPSIVPTTLKPKSSEETAVIDVPIQIEGRTFRVTCVSMGNPHCIILVDNLEEVEKTLDYWGPRVENSPWFPKRTNVEFIKVVDQNQIKVIVWERGVGRTLACGTGACASVVAVKLLGFAVKEQEVVLPGGKLHCHWDSDDHVYMTGPAEKVFEGHFMG